MSRIIQQIATVQFQVDNRKVTASMNALQTEAESLNGKIAAINQNIKNLGDVPPDNKFLLEYQKQLRQLNSDLKDVTTAQRDLMKGVKAADQLWKAARTQDIESLSIKAIKAGQNGLRKRMENLRPELGGDEQKMYDAYKAVIDEADRVMNVFKSNYATVVQTIRDGGIVSEQAMKSTRDALRDLMESEKEGTAEHRQLAQQYDFLNESLNNVAEMRRREKGEIVNANDARREALKLTEDGIAAARRERDMADAVIAGMQQQKSDLDQLRRLYEDRIAQTEREIAANQRLEEAEQDRLADVEKAMRYTENEDRKEASRLRKKADAARDEAEAKKEAYEEQAEQEKLLRQHVKDTGDEVTNLKAKIEALGKTEAKPKVDVEGVKKDIADLKAEYDRLASDWMAAEKMRNPHQMYATYEEFAKNVNHHGILKDLTYFDEDYDKYLDEMRKRQIEMKRQLVGDEVLQSPAYRDREKIAKSGYGMNDPRLMEMNEEYFFGAKEAKDIIEGEKAYDDACKKVANAIRDAHKKLREAFESGMQPEQVEGVAKQIQRLQSLYLGITDLGSKNGESMMGSGKDIVKNIFGGDFDKEIAKIEAQIKRVMTLAEKNKYDYYDEHFGKEREDALVKQQAIEKRQGEIKAELAQKDKIVAQAQQQGTTATNDQTDAIKKQEVELDELEEKLTRLNKDRDGYQNDVKESLKAVKDMGLTEEDLADDAKVREAVEKKVLEIMEAQAKVGQEIAEQRKKLTGEVKMSDLGGTKAEQDFYAKNKDRWDLDYYSSPDDVIERIAHLERLKKIKNGKRFNPDEDWDDDDDLDEDAPIMSDKEKQAINDELRFLKQHIREELLKTIREVGDIDKAVEQYTGGDGVSEDAKFGEQLNDKISEIKDKIEERIETTLDRYGEMLNEDRDIDSKMTKEQLTKRVSQHMEYVKENHGVNRSWLEEAQDDIETTEGEIEAKKQLIDQMKQQATSTKESTEAQQQSIDVSRQKAELEGQLADATKNHTKAQKDYKAQQEKTNKAQEKAYKAQEESVALNEKAAKAEEKVAQQEEEHAKAMDHQSERLRQIRAEGQRLLTQYEQQKTEIQAVDKAWADADVKQGEAEARKAQNQELTIKSLDDSIRKLKEANAVIDSNSSEWEENTRIIRKLQQAQDEISQKQKEMMGEWMSYAEAERFAAQAGTEGFIATGQQMQQAQQALERRRDALIKSIQVRRQEKNMTDEQKKALAAEEAQLDKVNAELKKMKFEMDNTNMSAKRMKEILDNPSAAKNIEELGQAVKRAQAQLKMMEDTIGNTNEEYKEMAKKTKEAAQRQKELEVQFKASASAFDKAWSRLKTYVGLYVGASVAMNKLMGTMGDLMELSDKMGEVRKTTGFTADEVGRLSSELKKFDTRTTLNGLLDLSVAAGQLGLKTQEDVLGFTEAANKLMVALPEMGKEGATEMLKVALATGEIDKIRKQMEEGIVDGSSATAVAMEKVGSTIDRLRATSAATAPAITDFVKRVGAVGAQSGISIDQVAALGSTVDALGMRVEMSATALSRMIPAIKNNAYSIGAMIGQTEEEIVRKFENGMGMSVILDIFEAIRNNSKMMTGDVEADAEQIEKEFEKAGLKEIMKELNQMGARAGIVFAGLSQNVDELRRQLGVAAEAYEENIAIEMEYQKMNETTAAKWERLKNELEETFVSDTAQRWLGGIIDFLRGIVNFISGDVNPVLEGLRATIATIGMAWITLFKLGIGEAIFKATGGLKNLLAAAQLYVGNVKAWIVAEWQLAVAKDAEAKATARATIAQLGWNKAMATNVILAVASALLMAYLTLKDWIGGCESAKNAMSDLNEKVDEEKRKLDNLVNAYHDANGNLDKRKNLLNEINQKYSKYLGFLLTDANNANLVAAAHERIAAALQKEMYERERAQGEAKVRQDFREDLSENWQEFTDELREYGLNSEEVAQARNAIQGFLNTVSYDDNAQKFLFADGTKEGIVNYMRNEHRSTNASLSDADAEEIMALWVYQYLETTFGSKLNADALKDIVGVSMITNSVGKGWDTAKAGSEFRGDYADYYTDMLEQIGKYNDDVNGAIAAANAAMKEGNEKMIPELKKQAETAIKTIQGNLNATDEEISAAYENLAAAIDGLEKISAELPQIAEEEGQSTSGDIVSYITGLFSGNPRVNTQKVTDARARLSSLWSRINQQRNGTNDNGGDNDNPRGPYGNYDKRVDPYEQWDANALVKRREDMLMRVRALAGGADVQTVLSMDKRFMDEATRKGIKNMRDAIAWYNEERLKIQEELHSRNLTNEGQWMDPKKGRSRKPKTPESEEAIAELDRYYLERKERIEEARANEEMTEAEYNRRLDALEQEHLERRSALRQTFTSKDKQFIQQFRQWWASVEELDEVSWETIEAEWLAAFDRDRKYNNRAAQKDLTQMQAIVVKQLREIEAIIDKERPFNGITRNLQDNLTKMGLLFKDGVPEDDKFMQENTRRLTFLLHEAENAYNMTFDQLAEDMRKNGLGAWADAITGSENAEKEKRAVIAQLHEVYDAVQEAIKKEASLVKKQVDITWNDALLPNGKSIKQTYEATISQLGIREDSVSRANSLIGAGTASQRVADRLAIRQMQMQLAMQEHYYNLVRQTGLQRIDDLKEQARLLREQGKMDEADRMELDAQHATMSLNLSLSKEQTELDKQREEIIARTEESQNRLYTSLREWADLLSSSVQSLFEASHAGEAEYYNELAKLNLTGKGGPGAGTYVIIDDAGTEDATAHYEYLSEREALERQREIERQNAQAEAWRKVMDDLNAKMNEQITDWLNAAAQNAALEMNSEAVDANTSALNGLTGAITNLQGAITMQSAQQAARQTSNTPNTTIERIGYENVTPVTPSAPAADEQTSPFLPGVTPGISWVLPEDVVAAEQAQLDQRVQMQADAVAKVQKVNEDSFHKIQSTSTSTNKAITTSAQSTFAKMTMAANMYGIAYQAMSNENLSTTQKFQMMALQAVGNYAISALTTEMAAASAKAATDSPGVLGTLWKQLGWGAAPVFAIFTGLLGGLMGLATSKISKAKSTIAQATGASGANAGRLATGMLTYAEGNVNEFTDPSTLTVGRSYNVDAADGKTYRARYMGKGAKTHLTHGPEFHLVGEAGQEAIIDAKTTRQIRMDDNGIWQSIQTLYNGGRISAVRRRRGRGMAAFADGNVEDFEDMAQGSGFDDGKDSGMSMELMATMQETNSRLADLLERALTNGIKAVNKWDGPDGIPNMYNRMEKEARRHGVKYL